ncbi:MAG: type II secretion system F family protein [Myxococcales bacterium]
MSIFELPSSLFWLRGAVLLAVVVCLGLLAAPMVRIPALPIPRFGLRGKRRLLARSDRAFRCLEVWTRHVGAWLAHVPAEQLRSRISSLALHAGLPMGLCADEWLALSLLSFLGLGCGGGWLVARAGMDIWWQLSVLGLAAVMPVMRLRQAATERAKQLERSLPNAIDLCVLCMGAGADFPAALRFVVAEMGAAHAACREELAHVLDELALGRTRVESLTALAQRTDSCAIRDFVAAVCQSDIKGTPLVSALDIQAGTLRQRRSVLAEEAAAKAGVRLMLPMMLMVVCVLLIVIGPFIVTGMGM